MKNICIIGICEECYGNYRIIMGYYSAIKSLFPNDNIFNYVNLDSLDNTNILFILDEHFGYHVNIWKNDEFITKCNKNKIQLIVLNNEKIYNSEFSINEDHQKKLNLFDNKIQYVMDIDDAILTGYKLNKLMVSKTFKDIKLSDDKIDKIVFVGRVDDVSYKERKNIITEISKVMEIDIISRDPNRSLQDYLYMLSKYRFCLCPIGNSNSFLMRFYEVLFTKSIPIQQIKSGMSDYYKDEFSLKNCIYFTDVNDVKNKIINFKEEPEKIDMWVEEFLMKNFMEDNIL